MMVATAGTLSHQRSHLCFLEKKPNFRTDLLLSPRAPLCPPFLALAVVLKELSGLVLRRGALTAVLVLPLVGVGALDWGQGALQRTSTPPEAMQCGRSAPPIH